MKILITGAAGFIGYHLVKAFLEKKDCVVGLDNLNDYYDVNLKHARLVDCGIRRGEIKDNRKTISYTDKNYTFYKTDLSDLDNLKQLFDEERFDMVVNMAAQAGVRYSLESPNSYVQSNLVGFVNILECCRHFNIKHLVYASSSSVYGMNGKVPFNEDDRVDYPVSLYAATKKSDELLAHVYSHLYQLPTTGLRFFTVYGPWGRPDMSPMLFADAIYNMKPIKVFNSGNMQRDFTYIDDIIKGVIKISSSAPNEKAKRPYYQIFNIGNSKPIKLMDFITTMEKVIGIKAKLKMYPMQPGDVIQTWADTAKLEALGYKSETSLEKGLSTFISWYKSFYINL